ncbi:helix-turn-helix domain-containing protein [Arsukibacterium sp.]|uniref:helix-turn-helix domain-containing protein n=1 Tax=Arsukibacterium sp. TaxID=1977258 RepID=UPI002FDA1B7E
MSQQQALMQIVKKSLRQQGLTYAQLATALDLSEASVKRMFSKQQVTLQRLEQICQLLGLELTDLLRLLDAQQAKVSQLTEQQERELTEDLGLLLVAVSVLNRWTMQQIIDWYQLSETECLQKLLRLDRLQLIELLPHNKVKLRVAPNFSWRESGPIQQFFQQKIASEFFNRRFNQQGEYLLVLNGMLSAASNQQFQRKLARLGQDFNELNRQDANLPLAQRHGVSVVLAMRDWRFGLFQGLLRKPVSS